MADAQTQPNSAQNGAAVRDAEQRDAERNDALLAAAAAAALDLRVLNSGVLRALRGDRALSARWRGGTCRDAPALRAGANIILITAGGINAANSRFCRLTGPKSAGEIVDAILKTERGEPLDIMYAQQQDDDAIDALPPWRHGLTCAYGVPCDRSCAACPRQGFCGLALVASNWAADKPPADCVFVFGVLWSPRFCGASGMAAGLEDVDAEDSDFFTAARALRARDAGE
jgi:hypothetical protein